MSDNPSIPPGLATLSRPLLYFYLHFFLPLHVICGRAFELYSHLRGLGRFSSIISTKTTFTPFFLFVSVNHSQNSNDNIINIKNRQKKNQTSTTHKHKQPSTREAYSFAPVRLLFYFLLLFYITISIHAKLSLVSFSFVRRKETMTNPFSDTPFFKLSISLAPIFGLDHSHFLPFFTSYLFINLFSYDRDFRFAFYFTSSFFFFFFSTNSTGRAS